MKKQCPQVRIKKKKEEDTKEYSNYSITALISHTSKAMVKVLQQRFLPYLEQEMPDGQAGSDKEEALEI